MIAKDKIKHAIVGIIVFALGYWITDIGSAFFFTYLVAVLKETNDRYRFVPILLSKVSTGFDFGDIVATVLIPTLFFAIKAFI